MEKVTDTKSRMVIAGRTFREFDSFYWNAHERIARLAEEGTAMQVLSPLPELLSYWFLPDAGEALTDFMNGVISETVARAPDRFFGFGAVVLQEPERAVRQLESFASQGLRGVLVGSHINDRSLAEPVFYQFLSAAESLGMVVFVHGIKPGRANQMLGPVMIRNVVGVPHETAMTISSFIMTDILRTFPRLKLAFAHGGGTLGSVIDRIDTVWSARSVMRDAVNVSPAEYVRRFYYDTAVFGADYLSFLVRKVGATQLIAGSDGPADMGQPTLRQFLASVELTEPERECIAFGNVERLFAL